MASQVGDGKIAVVYSETEIAARVDKLAHEIAARLDGEELIVIPILKGSFVFAADLIRAMHRAGMSPDVDFMTLSSYRKGLTSSGTVDIKRDIETEVKGRTVLVIDDILESGRTLAFAKDLLGARGAKHVLTCVLLDKPVRRGADIKADFKAFDCPNEFMIGYGMDAGHRYRELPFVGKLVQK
ncbi:MAG: hypoxanthine phosphoribosyltransferase [Pseudomonadota bacterium]